MGHFVFKILKYGALRCRSEYFNIALYWCCFTFSNIETACEHYLDHYDNLNNANIYIKVMVMLVSVF